jgi:hypothetical protein
MLLRRKADSAINPSLSSRFPFPSDEQQADAKPVGRLGRALLAAAGLVLLGCFALAFELSPDPRGYGTHESLGLPPCTLRLMFGIPCPVCGMTTSFAHLTKGHWHEAARANVSAMLLASLCAALVPWCAAGAWRGRLWGLPRADVAAAVLLGVVCGASLVEWIVRLACR